MIIILPSPEGAHVYGRFYARERLPSRGIQVNISKIEGPRLFFPIQPGRGQKAKLLNTSVTPFIFIRRSRSLLGRCAVHPSDCCVKLFNTARERIAEQEIRRSKLYGRQVIFFPGLGGLGALGFITPVVS